MKIKRLIATGLAVGAIMFAGTATADLVTVPINFDGSNIDPFSYSFIAQGGTSGSQTNCPTDDDDSTVGAPCVQLGKDDGLVISITPPPADTFDLVSFYWEYTGNQTNAVLTVSFLPEGTQTQSYPVQVNQDAVFQVANIGPISQVTFFNANPSIVRLDNISLTYDDGLCSNCPPPPCGDDCPPPPNPVPEPGTLGLLGLGLLGLAARRRTKV